MSCIKTPFKYNVAIQTELEADLSKVRESGVQLSDEEVKSRSESTCAWLCTTPGSTTYRVNSIMANTDKVVSLVAHTLKEYEHPLPSILTNPYFPELITVDRWDDSVELDLLIRQNEVIVDIACGSAVLRGAHVFAPGVIGIPRGLSIGCKVSVFADVTKCCKKGVIRLENNSGKFFLGNGILRLTRDDLFRHGIESPRGIAVFMTEVASRLPILNESIFPKGWALLQNLPSIICSRILDPQPHETILDMCAAPGNKTTHISALMANKGSIVALEKIKSKVERMKDTCRDFSVANVRIFCFDSTKAVCDIKNKPVIDGPPFSEESFDRILLDGPCSGLGQRPQLYNSITIAQLRSYVPLQRKLLRAAVRLLKPGGRLVYSTCTITVAENEGIVSWALQTFSSLRLESCEERLSSLGLKSFGVPGLNVGELTEEQSNAIRRFGKESDSIGFFIACFVKNNAPTD